MTQQRTNLIQLIQRWGIGLILGVALSISAIDAFLSYRHFTAASETLRTTFLAQQKELIKKEVIKGIDLINHEKQKSERLTREKIRARIYQAASIADSIYQHNKDRYGPDQVRNMILDALRPIRFDEGRGYFFAIRTDGLVILNAAKPDLEGKNLLQLQDSHGLPFIKDLIAAGRRSGEGFSEYFWAKPGRPGNNYKKISFVRYFKPYDLVIGTGLYVDDVQREIENKLLALISRIRFGREGYIFINTYDGNTLVSSGRMFDGTRKLWEVFAEKPKLAREIFAKELAAAKTPGGDYIYYSHVRLSHPDTESPKVSYIAGIDDLGWLVGAGVYLDDVDHDIAVMQADNTRLLERKLFYFLLSDLIILLLFYLVFQRNSRHLKNDINLLISFFRQAAFSDTPIDRKLIQFEEFDRLAGHANTMLRDKMQAQQALKKEKKALQKSEAKFRNLVETSNDWIWEIDAQARFTYVSPQVETILGYHPDEVLGKTLFDFMSRQESEKLTSVLAERMEHREAFIILENVCQHKDGHDVVLETSGVPFFDNNGALAGYRGVARDITPRKDAEEEKKILAQRLSQAQRMESIGLMAGGVAHDLNNILAVIVGYPDLLLQELPADSTMRTSLLAIKESGERAGLVVADLLTVARGAASSREIHDLHGLINEYLISPEFKRLTSLYPKVRYDHQFKAAHSSILCSSVHIKKCLMNLITNATEAIINEGRVTITTANIDIDNGLARELLLEEGAYIILKIQDTGPGISRQDVEHIFEPFYTKKVMGKSGTGLGLTVVWNTMRDHQGKITVESDSRGTSFTLYFPVRHEAAKRNHSQPVNIMEGRGERILVIDDDPQLRDIARKMLTTLGYQVHTVQSGEEAVEFAGSQAIDLALIDMIMEPGINGLETYHRLLAIQDGLKAIITSGFSKSADVKRALNLGAGGYLRKPYSIRQLGLLVAQILAEQREERPRSH
jgi:PAS domain S-box-containing protein